MKLSKKGVDFIKAHEGFRSRPYQDQGGIWTIGYGTTRLGALPVDRHTPPMTEKKAAKILSMDVDATYGAAINRYVNIELKQNEYDALVSFAYNIGPHGLLESTLLKYVNKHQMAKAADEFPKWNHVQGRVNKGLTARREDERKMFLG